MHVWIRVLCYNISKYQRMYENLFPIIDKLAAIFSHSIRCLCFWNISLLIHSGVMCWVCFKIENVAYAWIDALNCVKKTWWQKIKVLTCWCTERLGGFSVLIFGFPFSFSGIFRHFLSLNIFFVHLNKMLSLRSPLPRREPNYTSSLNDASSLL